MSFIISEKKRQELPFQGLLEASIVRDKVMNNGIDPFNNAHVFRYFYMAHCEKTFLIVIDKLDIRDDDSFFPYNFLQQIRSFS